MPITSAIICRDAVTHAPAVMLTPVPVGSVTTSTALTVSGVDYLDRASSTAYSDYTLAQAVPAFGTAWTVTSELASRAARVARRMFMAGATG